MKNRGLFKRPLNKGILLQTRKPPVNVMLSMRTKPISKRGSNIYEKIKSLRRTRNITTGKTMNAEEIAALLGMHPKDVERIRKLKH